MRSPLVVPESPFYTPSGRYYADARDAAFWTRVELARDARERERKARYVACHEPVAA